MIQTADGAAADQQYLQGGLHTRLAQPTVIAAIRPLLESGTLARTTMTDLEIGFSARNGDEWDAVIDALSVWVPLQVHAQQFHRALEVQRLLAAAGHRGRKIPDLLIAATAEQNHLTVLHYDGDYDLIAGVTGQPAEWVVPAGSMD